MSPRAATADDILATLGKGRPSRHIPADIEEDDAPDNNEFVVQKNQQVRHAGSDRPDGAWVTNAKRQCESSLYIFTKSVLRRRYLTKSLHLPICNYIQKKPPMRKGMLLPREHAKTTIVSQALPTHNFIQSAATNPYFPGVDGADVRLILCTETRDRGGDQLRVIEGIFESNRLFRAFWPERCWLGNPKRESKAWNRNEMILPRAVEFPDPHLRVIGVDGAITGAHPLGLIKDDLATIKAANSPTVMHDTYRWHIASRALINRDECLEWIIGTHWTVDDIYVQMMREDPSIQWVVRHIVEQGKSIYPEEFSMEKIDRLRIEFGVLFPLIYMNTPVDPRLTDFNIEMIRDFRVENGIILFNENEKDLVLFEKQMQTGEQQDEPMTDNSMSGCVLSEDTYDMMKARSQFIRMRAA